MINEYDDKMSQLINHPKIQSNHDLECN